MRIGLVLIIPALLLLTDKKEQRNTVEEKPLHVSELNTRKVIGELGHPLGEMLQIQGQVVDGEVIDGKAYSGDPVLKVQKVQEKKLAKEVFLRFSRLDAPRVPLAIGNKFKLIGYETGCFAGKPRPIQRYFQDFSFGFETTFIVWEDGLKKK